MKNSNIPEKSAILKAISNAKRLEILYRLKDGESSVGQLEELVNLSQSALSQHLAVLRRAKVVKTRRNAQTIYYSIDNQLVKDILRLLEL